MTDRTRHRSAGGEFKLPADMCQAQSFDLIHKVFESTAVAREARQGHQFTTAGGGGGRGDFLEVGLVVSQVFVELVLRRRILKGFVTVGIFISLFARRVM